ncbi:hypothetical protein MWN34_15690 [Ancylobacter sp. 6x-1]|uniref:Energy transducer TonB n=1 Tax=Ancylobacter crimeensis TaxID=2579147 RepID=A0ABT0DEF7_9HYPH|nr:hypothetical protein [Ancylobacter crimeensis]MCK0198355.1 hypothetical protein [Ancylobacter crimeensis]
MTFALALRIPTTPRRLAEAGLQLAFCAALVAGTYALTRPVSPPPGKDVARLLQPEPEAQYVFAQKGDRLAVVNPTEAAAPAPAPIAEVKETPENTMASIAAPLPPERPAEVAQSAAATTVSKPRRVAVESPVARFGESRDPQLANPPRPSELGAVPPPPLGAPVALRRAPVPPPVQLADAEPLPPAPVVPAPPREEGFLGLPPLPSVEQVVDGTVDGTRQAWGRMKDAVQTVIPVGQ